MVENNQFTAQVKCDGWEEEGILKLHFQIKGNPFNRDYGAALDIKVHAPGDAYPTIINTLSKEKMVRSWASVNKTYVGGTLEVSFVYPRFYFTLGTGSLLVFSVPNSRVALDRELFEGLGATINWEGK